MNKKLILLLTAIFFTTVMFAQAPAIEWQKSLGGSGTDRAFSTQQTSDGGYIVAGYTDSGNGDVTYNPEGNCWIVKLTNTGSIQWQKSLEGYETYSVQQTSDGGYIVAGDIYRNSNGHGFMEYWILKLNNNGVIQWKKNLGGSHYDIAYSVRQTSDGGYIVAGKSLSNNGDVTGNHGNDDYWIVKLDTSGNIQWQKSLGGGGSEYAHSIQQTADGGYIVAGYSDSNDGDVTGNHGGSDYWIVKLNSNGSIQWQKSLGGNSIDNAYAIQQTSDGGYIVAGESYSNSGDVTGNHGLYDYWVVKLDNTGSLQWQKSLGGSKNDRLSSIRQTSEGGYIVTGYSESNNGDVTGNHGLYDYWVVKLDNSGVLQWQKSIGGSSNDYGSSIQQTTDGGYIVAGRSGSNNGDVTGNHGGSEDYWIVKLYPEYLNSNETTFKNNVFVENPAKDLLKLQSNETIKSLQLYNSGGQLIKTSNSQNMSVKELSKGLYILKVQLENGKTISEKIIKE